MYFRPHLLRNLFSVSTGIEKQRKENCNGIWMKVFKFHTHFKCAIIRDLYFVCILYFLYFYLILYFFIFFFGRGAILWATNFLGGRLRLKASIGYHLWGRYLKPRDLTNGELFLMHCVHFFNKHTCLVPVYLHLTPNLHADIVEDDIIREGRR